MGDPAAFPAAGGGGDLRPLGGVAPRRGLARGVPHADAPPVAAEALGWGTGVGDRGGVGGGGAGGVPETGSIGRGADLDLVGALWFGAELPGEARMRGVYPDGVTAGFALQLVGREDGCAGRGASERGERDGVSHNRQLSTKRGWERRVGASLGLTG